MDPGLPLLSVAVPSQKRDRRSFRLGAYGFNGLFCGFAVAPSEPPGTDPPTVKTGIDLSTEAPPHLRCTWALSHGRLHPPTSALLPVVAKAMRCRLGGG